MAFLVNNPQNICFADVPHMHHLFEEVCPAVCNESFWNKNGNNSFSINLNPNGEKGNSAAKKKMQKNDDQNQMGSESESAGRSNDADKYLDVDMKSYQTSRSHSNTSYLNTNSVMQLNNFGMQVKTRAFTLIKYKNGDIYYG